MTESWLVLADFGWVRPAGMCNGPLIAASRRESRGFLSTFMINSRIEGLAERHKETASYSRLHVHTLRLCATFNVRLLASLQLGNPVHLSLQVWLLFFTQ